jgi:hypothetical protein
MTSKSSIAKETKTPNDAKKPSTTSSVSHPGMMGDGTEEQSLGEKGNPAARITEDDVDDAFQKAGAKKSS